MLRTLKKYLAVARIGFQEGLEYRTEFFINLIGWSVRLMISVFLFAAVYSGRDVIQGYTFKDMITYFLVIQVLMTFSFIRAEFRICADIQNGDFSNYLVKPISYIGYLMIAELSKNFVRSWLGIGLFGVIIALIQPEFFVNFPYGEIPLILVSILLSFFVNSILMVIIALLSFWVVSANRILFMFFAVLSIFSGMLIPIQFFPESLQRFLDFTPFPYIFYYPAKMMIQPGGLDETFRIIAAQLIIIIIEYAIMALMYRIGIKKYEAVGR